MTKQHVQQPMQFNNAELKARQQAASDHIMQNELLVGDAFSTTNPEVFINHIVKMTKQNAERYPIPPVILPTFFSITYYRSKEEIDALLSQSDQQVEKAYRAEIDEFNNAQIELLAEQLYQAEQKKIDSEARKAAQAKAREQAMAEAEQYFRSITTKQTNK